MERAPDVERFETSDGITIVFRRWGEPSAQPPVVLHHGFIVDAVANFEAPGLVAALVAAGRQVIAPDARGHGASGKPHDTAAYGERRMARDLAQLLDHLGLRSIDLVGYSMGAVVAAIFATQDRRVRRLVLSGVGAALAELGGLDTLAQPPSELVAVLLTESGPAVQASPAVGFRILADAVGADRVALAAQANAANTTPIPLAQITAPTLVLAGADDPLAARPQDLAAAIPGATWRLVGGDHTTTLLGPAYAPALVDFLAT